MAKFNAKPTQKNTYVAGADLSSSQYKLVKLSTAADNTVLLATEGDEVIGVLLNDPASGEDALVGEVGHFPVVAGGSITRGDELMADDNGDAIVATAGNPVFGVATHSMSDGDVGSVALVGRAKHKNPHVISLPIKLANVSAADVLTAWTPGYAGTIVKVAFVVTDAVTTGGDAATLNLEIGTTDLTGGAIALTSANCTPLGAVIAGTTITGNNVFSASDTISVEASSVTAFAEGEGVLLITVE